MLSHYITYLVVGGFYFFWLSSAASAAAELDGPGAVAMFGCIGLVGVAAPLAILKVRRGAGAALLSLLLLCPWIILISIEIIRSPNAIPGFALISLAISILPATYVGLISVRSIRGSTEAKVQIPRALRYVLAAPLFLVPISMAILVVTNLAARAAA